MTKLISKRPKPSEVKRREDSSKKRRKKEEDPNQPKIQSYIQLKAKTTAKMGAKSKENPTQISQKETKPPTQPSPSRSMKVQERKLEPTTI